MSLTLEVGFPRYFCGNKDMVENSCWVNNSSWIKAHKSNFTFIAYVLEFNKSIGKTIAKKRNDAYQDELLRQIVINMCIYLKWSLIKIIFFLCDSSLLRRTTLWGNKDITVYLVLGSHLSSPCWFWTRR